MTTLSHRQNLVIIALIVGVLAFIWYQWGGSDPWDDAYISFNYAQNLADGHGLVWYIGGEPTQGYTNFLFVVMLAAGIKLGISPLLLAYLLNTFGLILIGWSFYFLTEKLLESDRFLALLIPLAVIALPISLLNVLTGLETVFWTGLIFSAALFTQRYVISQTDRDLFFAAALSFACCLTRPEGVLLAGLWWLYLLTTSPKKRSVIIGIVLFGIAGLIYLVWLHLYFGDVLPNPFYVKVRNSETLPGLIYVLQGVAYVGLQPLSIAGILGLPLAFFRLRKHALPYLIPLILLVFYMFTDPVMGEKYRFLYPALCVLTFITALGFVLLVKALWTRFPSRVLMGVSAVIAIGIITGPLLEAAGQRIFLIGSSHQPGLLRTPTRIGLALQDVPGIQHVTVAYGDAGAVPYYTRARLLDFVGLNDNTIAHNASREGAEWVIEYTLAQQPDLIAFYTTLDGTIWASGHGVIGGYMDELYLHPDFQENYTYVAGFDNDFSIIQWFVRQDSPYAAALTDALQAKAEFTEYQIIPG